MTCSRREFLAGISWFASAAVLGRTLPAMAQAISATNHYLIVGSGGSSVAAVNLSTRRVISIPIGFGAHGFAQHPLKPERVWAIEKWGRSAAEIDFKEGKVTQRLTSPPATGYFGHGFFTTKGDTLFVVQTDLKTGLGHLIGYDGITYQPSQDYQVTPGALHDCHLLPDNTFIVVSHGSTMLLGADGKQHYNPMVENASLVHFDPQQGKVLDKKYIGDEDQILGHFAVSQNGTIIALGIPRPDSDPTVQTNTPSTRGGALYYGRIDKPELRRIAVPDTVNTKLRGEMLSIAVNEAAHLTIVTNPESQTLLLIDIADGTYLGQMTAVANGISYDPAFNEFISSGAQLSLVDDHKKELLPLAVKTASGGDYSAPFTGAHSTIIQMDI